MYFRIQFNIELKKLFIKSYNKYFYTIKNYLYLSKYYKYNYFFKNEYNFNIIKIKDITKNNFFNKSFINPKIKNIKYFKNDSFSNYHIYFSRIYKFKEYSLRNILLKERIFFMPFFSQYIIILLNNKLNKKILLQSSKYKTIESSFFNFKKSLVKKLRNAPNIRRLRIRFRVFIKVVYALFKYKDLEIFKRWVEITMTRLPFKFHRRFLYSLKVLFFIYLFPYFKLFNVLGLVIKTSGKISLGGNSKTRTYYIKSGKYPRTTKSLKLLYAQSNVFTLSGALGLCFYFTYL